MIAVDTSSLIAFLKGDQGDDVEKINLCLESGCLALPPPVLSEILSDHKLPRNVYDVLIELPVLEITKGYWQRVGYIRATLLSKNLKARLADSLIAQSCLDHNIALITRDQDFRHFEKYCQLKLY